MWVVRTGSAAVFAARIEDGAPVGERRFVGRVGSGGSLLGLGTADSSIQLIALAIEDLTLVEHPLNGLPADYLIDGAPLSERLEDWVSRSSAFVGAESGSAEIERITESGEICLDEGQRTRPARDTVFWLSPKTGRAGLLGAEYMGIRPGARVPLGSGAWIEASEAVTLTAARAAELEVQQMLDGLDEFHALVAAHLESLDASEREAEVRRLEQRGVLQAQLRESALDEMASVLNPRTLLPHRDTDLLTAVTAVGDALGIEIHPPATSENLKRVKDPVDAIARASRVRHRRVLLRGPVVGKRLRAARRLPRRWASAGRSAAHKVFAIRDRRPGDQKAEAHRRPGGGFARPRSGDDLPPAAGPGTAGMALDRFFDAGPEW